jgi:hypothetical protein
VVTVEPLVVLGLFVVAVIGGADSGAGTLVGAVRQAEDLSGQARLDALDERPVDDDEVLLAQTDQGLVQATDAQAARTSSISST